MSDALKPQLHGRDHRPGGRDPIPTADDDTPVLRARMSGYTFAAAYADIEWFNGGEGGFTVVNASYYEDLSTNDGTIRILQPGTYFVHLTVGPNTLFNHDTQIDGTIRSDTSGFVSSFWGGTSPNSQTVPVAWPLRIYGGDSAIAGQFIDLTASLPAPPFLLFTPNDTTELIANFAWLEDGTPTSRTTALHLTIARLRGFTSG